MFCSCYKLPSLLIYLWREDNSKADGDDNDQFQSDGRLLPQTPYSTGDFDQAVAIGIGIITLLLSIRDLIQDYNLVIDDEFEYWRARCVRSIESGDTKMEVVRWKQELEVIDKMARCMRTRIRHRRREHEAFEKIPEPVRLLSFITYKSVMCLHCMDRLLSAYKIDMGRQR
jgi:hypothetical protein